MVGLQRLLAIHKTTVTLEVYYAFEAEERERESERIV
jgi:hypothetical protein